MRRWRMIGLMVVLAVVLAACAPGVNPEVGAAPPDGEVAGFWMGLWHGIIAPITFVISLFTDDVNLYDVYNNGNWVQQWQSPQIPAMFGTANLISGDFDNDGSLEVALTPWNDLILLDMATGQIEGVATLAAISELSLGPDGALAALAPGDTGYQLLISALTDSSNAVSIPLEAGAYATQLVWSPDGQSIAFVSSRDGNAEIYLMRADGREYSSEPRPPLPRIPRPRPG